MTDILVQCTRCRNKHMESERVSKPRDAFVSDLCCPRCGSKSFYDLRPQVAWCWASGLIEVGDALPPDSADGTGAIQIANGPKAFLKGALEVVARHGKGASAGKLLVPGVPGVPEAENAINGVTALQLWVNWCARRNGSARAQGVMFAKSEE